MERPGALRLVIGGTIAVLVSAATAGPVAADRGDPARPGTPGIGDAIFPTLGNGGYDVAAYDLNLTWDPTRRRIAGRTSITASATQELSRFDLDFGGGTVSRVTVDGVAADYTVRDGELNVRPRRTLHDDQRFRVDVTHRTDPVPVKPPTDFIGQTPLFSTADGGFVVAAQPDTAHLLFPSNDHPADKARYRFAITVPNGTTAVANGTLTGRASHGRTTTWSYRTRDPMASELVQVAVGKYAVVRRRGPHQLPIRDVVPTAQRTALEPVLARTPSHVAWLERRLGRYPFETYGVLAADVDLGFALETQTLSLFSLRAFRAGAKPEQYEPVMVHELAHQWFGDSVSPLQWRDVWLNEGHATWYENTYAEARGWDLLDGAANPGRQDLTGLMKSIYAISDDIRAEDGPVARPKATTAEDVFNLNVYYGGALALYALRQEVGPATFARIERAWVARHRNGVQGTDDFIDLASSVSGRDLSAFLEAWLYGTTTPPMPGHPDWRTQSPTAGAAKADLTARAVR